jgi:hypothetical protein
MARFMSLAIFAFSINIVAALFSMPAFVPPGFGGVTDSLWQDSKWNQEVIDDFNTAEFAPANAAKTTESGIFDDLSNIKKGFDMSFDIARRSPTFIPFVIGQIFRSGGVDEDSVNTTTTLMSAMLYIVYILGLAQFISGRNLKNMQ